MRLCPSCGNSFPDDANFCPMDRLGDPMCLPVEHGDQLQGFVDSGNIERDDQTVLASQHRAVA